MELIIKGTIPRVPPFFLWNLIKCDIAEGKIYVVKSDRKHGLTSKGSWERERLSRTQKPVIGCNNSTYRCEITWNNPSETHWFQATCRGPRTPYITPKATPCSCICIRAWIFVFFSLWQSELTQRLGFHSWLIQQIPFFCVAEIKFFLTARETPKHLALSRNELDRFTYGCFKK